MRRKKNVPVPKPGPGLKISDIIETTRQPGGFAKLSSNQRRLLIAALLGAVIPRDGKVLDVERQHYLGHLKNRYQFSATEQYVALYHIEHEACTEDQLLQAARQLPELLSAEDRGTLIGLMWDLACCDQEIHATEAELIFKISDSAGVVRKRAVEEQARAARANGITGSFRAA